MPGFWSFERPEILWGLLLCLLPGLIFLMWKRQPAPIPWGAMRFLRQAQEKMQNRLRFREFLILTLQTLAIFCLVLAAASPIPTHSPSQNLSEKEAANGFSTSDSNASGDSNGPGDSNASGDSNTSGNSNGSGDSNASGNSNVSGDSNGLEKEVSLSEIPLKRNVFFLILDNSASMGAAEGVNVSTGRAQSRFQTAEVLCRQEIGRLKSQQNETQILLLPTNWEDSGLDGGRYCGNSSESPEESGTASSEANGSESQNWEWNSFADWSKRSAEWNLRETRISTEKADWPGTLKRIAELLAGREEQCRGIRVFSDLADEGEELEIFLRETAKLVPQKELSAIAIGTLVSNLSLSELKLLRTPPLAGFPQPVEAVVQNHSNLPAKGVRVTLTVRKVLEENSERNGAQTSASSKTEKEGRPEISSRQGKRQAGEILKRQEKWIQVPAHEALKVPFELEFPEKGEFLLEAEVTFPNLLERETGKEETEFRDGFRMDDSRRICVSVKEKAEFLLAEAWSSEFQKQENSGTLYLRAALEAIFKDWYPEAGEKVLRIDARQDTDLTRIPLETYDSVILCGLPVFTSQEVQALEEYVHAGGSIWAFPGEKTNSESFAPLRAILPGVTEGGKITEANGSFLRPILPKERHEVTDIFRENPESGLENVPVSSWFSIVPVSESQTVLELSNGKGFWLVRDGISAKRKSHRGKETGGRSVLCALSADAASSTLPLLPVWVPLTERTLHFLTSAPERLPDGTSANCSAEESAILNQRIPLTAIPEVWEVQNAEEFLEEARRKEQNSAAASILFLAAALALGTAAYLTPGHSRGKERN